MITSTLIEAMIDVESEGDPNAVSPVGAKGLMQLMDPTGLEWHARLDMEKPYDPFDPEQNVAIGTAYITYLFEIFGNEKLALAAYNWGQGNLKKLINTLGANDWDYLSRSPKVPSETRNYVIKVLKKKRELESH